MAHEDGHGARLRCTLVTATIDQRARRGVNNQGRQRRDSRSGRLTGSPAYPDRAKS